MERTTILRGSLHWAWRLGVCSLTYVVGTMIGGAVVSALGMQLPQIPEQADERTMGMCLMIGSLALAAGIAPLAKGLQGSFRRRWLILTGLCYVCLGINTPIEAAIFTNLGGMSAMAVFSIIPCGLLAAVVALLFHPSGQATAVVPPPRRFVPGHGSGRWAWRLTAAVCAFPVIYWVFGMMVGPFVLDYYRAGDFGLTLPGVGTIILVQLLRSALFLAAALPVLMYSSGSRLALAWKLGLAFYVLVGLFGMIQSYWLAPILRALHNVEILADSMVYALTLSWLFAGAGRARHEVSLTDPFLSLRHA
ncbi:MAG: hypothetical protein JSW27_21010 [Phycisphaerales bacterium]|nr:MAG: hypothetical protein JSW27_21010 [Phycisphaerales bacterium]